MKLLGRHLQLGPPLRVSGWRNIAIGTWRSAKDPSVYGVLEMPAEAAMGYAKDLSAATKERVTITHILGKAVAMALTANPEINAVQRFGRLHPRQSVSLFFQVAADDSGRYLSGAVVRQAEHKSVATIASELSGVAKAVRAGKDLDYKRMKSLMALLPGWTAAIVLNFAGFVQYSLNLWTPLFGTPKDPLGSVMITNVGSLGLEFAFAPLVPYARVPLVIAQCAVRDRPVAENGAVVVRSMLRLCVTFDHRLIDGVQAAKLARVVELVFADPVKALGPASA